ncbi:MAG: B12-binding domain-containing protein [Methanomethylovorans sp.]|uniref:B12-binding domain-containing protein n=1 Tax=Methanomethylovorans sp. TaxID=2758717 RepID=UPI003C73D1F3
MQTGTETTILLARAKKAIIEHDNSAAKQVSYEALDAGISPLEFIELGFIEGMKVLGDLFEHGDIDLQDIFEASLTMNIGIDVLRPHIISSPENAYAFEDLVLMI